MTGKIPVTKSGKRKQYRSPEAILRRNDQERARQKEMNDAFDNLRKVIPLGEWKGKKKSKCETLQGAIEHIENLLDLLATPQAQNYANNYSSPTSSLDQSGYSYGSSQMSHLDTGRRIHLFKNRTASSRLLSNFKQVLSINLSDNFSRLLFRCPNFHSYQLKKIHLYHRLFPMHLLDIALTE